MKMKKKKVGEIRAGDLYSLLVASPLGLTRDDIEDATGWTYSQTSQAIQTLRDILASNGDTISVPCEPQGQCERWVYTLSAGTDIIDGQWAVNRVNDAERRCLTLGNVLNAAVRSTDGRTVEGRKARIYALHINRAREEVALMVGTEQD